MFKKNVSPSVSILTWQVPCESKTNFMIWKDSSDWNENVREARRRRRRRSARPQSGRRWSGGSPGAIPCCKVNPCLTLSAASVVNLRASNITCLIVVRSGACTVKFYGFLKRKKIMEKFIRQYYNTFLLKIRRNFHFRNAWFTLKQAMSLVKLWFSKFLLSNHTQWKDSYRCLSIEIRNF